MSATGKMKSINNNSGAGLVPARLAEGKEDFENNFDTGTTDHRSATRDPGRDEPCPYIVLLSILGAVCLMFVGCGGPKRKYQVGEIYQPAANHSAWTKLNQRPRQSGAHNKFVTIYANELGNQVKQHGGQYQAGSAILKE